MRTLPRVAVVIATRNRADLLSELLAQLQRQDLPIDRVVVVDSSDDDLQALAKRAADARWPAGSEFLGSDRASTPYQRNLGVDALLLTSPAPDYIAFLDDDVRPAADYLHRLVCLLEGDTSLAGACGVTDDVRVSPPLPYRLYAGVFRLWSSREGRLLRSGVNTGIRPTDGPARRSDWLIGCSVWRSNVFVTTRFNGDMPGGALFEDVEFSGRVGRTRSLVVDPQARLHHLYADEGRAGDELHSFRWIRNRYEVVRTVHQSRLCAATFWWSTAGELLLLAAKTVYDRRKHGGALRGAVRGAIASVRNEPMR